MGRRLAALPLRATCTAALTAMLTAVAAGRPAAAQRPAPVGPPVGSPFAPLPGPAPTARDLAYARSDATTGQGHLLDLYLPTGTTRPVPVVIFTHGSAWMADNGRMDAQALAAVLNPKGYAVAGVAVRSSAQVRFPGQLYDIKAAIRWLRAHAATYGLDPAHVGIVGESSGGWTAAMAAVTGDVPELEGHEGPPGGSSAVQAAIAFYPPTDFLQMDAWALGPCDPAATLGPPAPGAPARGPLCHDAPTSPESRFIGCPIQSCPAKVQAANPVRYISRADPPILIVHGESDRLVPYAQGELLYQALNKACHDAVFISLPVAPHGVWYRAWTDPALAAAATRRSTASAGCAVELPTPYTPSWATVVEFLDRYLKPAAAQASRPGAPPVRMPALPSIPTPPRRATGTA